MSTKIGRNASCPCGSGKKYKYCCMRKKLALKTAQRQLRVKGWDGALRAIPILVSKTKRVLRPIFHPPGDNVWGMRKPLLYEDEA